MNHHAILRQPWAVLALAWCLLGAARAPGALNLGDIEISRIGHTFQVFNRGEADNPAVSVITDWLIDQSHFSDGGSVLPTITANLDTEDTFVLKLSAPPGKKFWIHPPPGQGITMGGYLLWQATTNPALLSPIYGTHTLTLGGLVGIKPEVSSSTSVYSPTEDFFGPAYFGFPLGGNELTFTSITISNTVTHTNANRGSLTYHASPNCSLTFDYFQSLLADRGPMISLIPIDQPVNAVVPLGEALDTADVDWKIIGQGYLPWSGRLLVSHDGTDAAESGDVPNNAAVTLQSKAMGPGTLSWWWKVSSETNHDYLKFFIDGVQQTRISGEVDWQRRSFRLDLGMHILKWTYSKDVSGSAGSDKGWIDQVRFEPDTNCAFNLAPANRTHDFGSVTGTVEVATSPDCSWTVVCTNHWIVALSPVANRGSGTLVYALTKNPTAQPRTGFLLIAGRPFPIFQAAGPTNELPRRLDDLLDVRINPFSIEPRFGGLDQSGVTHDGVDAAQIGPLPDDATSSIHAKVLGPGTISFWWKVSSETNLDMLKFFGPEGEVRISGEVDWQFRSYLLPPGSNRIFWVYATDESVSMGNDRGWLDQLQFVPETNCPVAISPKSRRHSFGPEGGDIQVTLLTNCMWSAWTTSDWIGLPLSITNTMNGVVNYSLAPNATGQDRTGMVQIADQVFTIMQSNGVCTTEVFPTNAVHGWQRETGLVTVATFPGCPWNTQNTNPWISILSIRNFNPGGEIVYAVATNPAALPRNGSLKIGDAVYTIRQTGQPGAPLVENNLLGSNRVTTIGHKFKPPGLAAGPPPGARPGLVSDFLIDQDQASGGGALLPNLSAVWDANNQFTWKIVAPPGQKFVIQPPPGARANFEGSLHWDASGGGASPPGFVAATFGGLIGSPPILSGEASLSDTHGYFGLTLTSTPFTNSFSFTSMTLVGLVTPYQTGLGRLAFHPRLDSALDVEYETVQTNDPGPFVFVVPRDPPLHLTILEHNPTNGTVLMLQGPRLQAYIVQATPDLVHWTTISINVMPDIDCFTCPYLYIIDRTSIHAPLRFYRAFQR